MKKIELLAPAGDKESFKAALNCGADAIYIGGESFSARAHATNFTKEDIQWAVKQAHIFCVKVYVTVNTLYKDNEFDELMNYIHFLYESQVDALIVQDLGLFLLVRNTYPDFEIHMSTQASLMNVQGVQYFDKLGAKRVVLARENTLDEIKEIIHNTHIEIEVFVHGALCVSYSGQCLMSSMIGQRSGNRGECAQPCRLQYRLMQDNKLLENKYPYMLSPRDLMTIDNIDHLIESGIHSLKIEGRMKKPEYVASTVLAYRKAIDAYYNKESISLNNEKQNMLSMFNRNYTSGYLFNDKHIVDGDYSGNKGVIIGYVLSYNRKLKLVKIKLSDELFQGDSIVFETIDKGRPVNKIYKNGKLVNHASMNDIIDIEFNKFINKGNVRKTVDTKVLHNLQQAYSKPLYKHPINMVFQAKIGFPATLSLKDDHYEVTVKALSNVAKAKTTATTKQRIQSQLNKLGQTPFYANHINIITDDHISIPIKEINELRRKGCEILEYQLSHKIIHKNNKQAIAYPKQKASQKQSFYVQVSSLEQLKIVKDYPDIEIIYPYQSNTIKAFQIYPKLILATSKVLKTQEIFDIKQSQIYSLVDTILINNYGAYEGFHNRKLIMGTGMSIYNSFSAEHYSCKKILSNEMNLQEINHIHTDMSKCIIQIYGKIENMVSDYCPISHYYFGYLKKNCNICQNHKFALIDRKNEKFDIITDEYCRMHLMNCRTLLFNNFSLSKIKSGYIHFTNENSQEVMLIMDYFFKKNVDLKDIKKKMSLTNCYY
ncbi:MAG: DUF3656 domain-containing protein [Erysipelotrichaceae bacterium]|nr:DUF3656 domain-containing protein [Erysipelotrichaceae bacterium]